MDLLSEMAVFARVVDAQSFSEAARRIGVSKSTVSKQIRRLEDQLGARLLDRTTRTMRLTEVGTVFYEHCARMLAEAEAAEHAVGNLESAPRGRLRITAPMTLGRIFVAPAASDFARQWPDLEVDLDLSDRIVDLVEDGYDLAVRVGRLAPSSLVARRLAPTRTIVCASADYLTRKGRPEKPSDLERHDCLRYTYQSSDAWIFRGAGGEEVVRVKGPFRANNGEALAAAACAGLGIAFLPDFIVGSQLASGELVPLLEAFVDDGAAVYAVYPARRHLAAKVRAFVDLLVERMTPAPPWLSCE